MISSTAPLIHDIMEATTLSWIFWAGKRPSLTIVYFLIVQGTVATKRKEKQSTKIQELAPKWKSLSYLGARCKCGASKINSGFLVSWKWSIDPSISISVTSLLYLCESINSFPCLLLCETGISRIIYCPNSGIQPYQKTVSIASIATGFWQKGNSWFKMYFPYQIRIACNYKVEQWIRSHKYEKLNDYSQIYYWPKWLWIFAWWWVE